MSSLTPDSGAVQLAATSIRMQRQLSSVVDGVSSSPNEPPKLRILSELPILVSLLGDIQTQASNSSTELPPTVNVALEFSVERFHELIECLSSMGLDPVTGRALPGQRRKMQQLVHRIRWTTPTEELQDATKRFRSALTLLRDIVMDHRTHDLIIQQQAYLSYEFDYTRNLLRKKHRLPSPDGFVDRTSTDTYDVRTESAEEAPSYKFKPGSGSLFSVTFYLDGPSIDRPLFYAARAKYDTGCSDCLITEAMIHKYEIHAHLQKVEPGRVYTGVGYTKVVSNSKIQLNWSANNETLSRRNTFYVVPDSPFELLLGEDFMEANSPMLPALAIIRGIHSKSKAQKTVENDRAAQKDREAAELAAQRRNGKAPQRAVSEGPKSPPQTTLPSSAARHPQALPQPSIASSSTNLHKQDDTSTKIQSTLRLESPPSPDEVKLQEKVYQADTELYPRQDTTTTTGTDTLLLPKPEEHRRLSHIRHQDVAASTYAESSSSGLPPEATASAVLNKSASMETRDSGYVTEPASKPVSQASNPNPGTAERISRPAATENKLVGDSNVASNGETRKRSWRLWRK